MHHIGRFRQMFIDFVFTLALPIGTAIVISEGVSKLIDRARPFVADKTIHLLVPHSADGGFPSHHTTVMISIAVAIWYRNHNLGYILFGLGLISGLARIAAGIHYPTDIFAGVVIGWITAWAVHNLSKDVRLRMLRR